MTLGPRDRAALSTAIASALGSVGGDLAEVTGPRIVVLITDGQETCQGDPAAAVLAPGDGLRLGEVVELTVGGG